MPRRQPRVPDPDAWAAWRVGWERERRGWSKGELARRVTAAGVPMAQQAIGQIENRNPPRKISYAEAIAFAKVFDLDDVTQLGQTPSEVTGDIRRQVGESLLDLANNLGPLVRLLREARKLPPDPSDEWPVVVESLHDRAREIGKAIEETESWLKTAGDGQ